MEVGSGAFSGIAEAGDHLPTLDFLAGTYLKA
jgi:hypothetical protein